MRIAAFRRGTYRSLGVVKNDETLIDLTESAPHLPHDLVALLSAGPEAMEEVRRATASSRHTVDLDSVQLEAPIARPPKFLAIGLNYRDHAAELGRETSDFPIVFNKQSTCITGPYDPIVLPKVSRKVDYEGELGFVIAARCRNVARADASKVIAGYLVVNDVSVRDWQRRSPTMTLGKSFDTHGPIGPWLVTADEIADPHALDIRTWVNGELRQESNTERLIHDCFALVETLSTACTLEAGDIVTTGTPAGVGVAMSPPRYLTDGDRVRVEIAGVGAIDNPVVAAE